MSSRVSLPSSYITRHLSSSSTISSRWPSVSTLSSLSVGWQQRAAVCSRKLGAKNSSFLSISRATSRLSAVANLRPLPHGSTASGHSSSYLRQLSRWSAVTKVDRFRASSAAIRKKSMWMKVTNTGGRGGSGAADPPAAGGGEHGLSFCIRVIISRVEHATEGVNSPMRSMHLVVRTWSIRSNRSSGMGGAAPLVPGQPPPAMAAMTAVSTRPR
mmetsp:Transcript_21685/g.61707  ORF Transcript_21685/g.61707 Transcript_21685/m.61707 type:complete len:214 (+) Transcript_21685:453-1094(+)